MLTKDLLRVTRRGGGYRPQFTSEDDVRLAARLLGVYQGHLGETRADLQTALTRLEGEADDFKLVRGFASLLDREATFETRALVDPERARETVFRVAAERGVVTDDERTAALADAAARLGATADALDRSLYADRAERQELVAFDARWTPDELRRQYDLSLAQTVLFDATEVRVLTNDPKAFVSAVKRLRLMYEIHTTPEGRAVVVTGPDALFRTSRRYGTRFARLLWTLVKTSDWHLDATIDDRGTERSLELDASDLSPPGTEPLAEPGFDSGVEADFATRFRSLDLDWTLVREPEPLESGAHVVIPDFAFDWNYSSFRVFFEIMGFWTPEYVEKKLSRLATLEAVELLVAVDASLGVGEDLEALDYRAIPYTGTVRLKDVRDALRRYEAELVAESAASLPDELRPDADVTTLVTLAEEYGVSEDAIEDKSFPDHEQVGRTLIRPTVLDTLTDRLAEGMELSEAEAVLDAVGIADASAALSRVGYRVEWDGLSGGVLRSK